MNKELELQTTVKQPLVIQPDGRIENIARPQPSVADMLRAVVDKGITQENVGALEKLCDLYERMEAKNAEKEFAAAFVQLQQDIPTIMGGRPIPDRNGQVKFRYANFEDIDAIVRPICLRHGFTYAFKETGIDNGRITVTMILQHSGGHSREVPYSVRVGSGPPGASESQADVSGHSYAQRGALESGLALRIVGAREDAKMEGARIMPAMADELERRVKETNSDVAAFLKYAGATKFSEIADSKYDMLDALLTKKERTR